MEAVCEIMLLEETGGDLTSGEVTASLELELTRLESGKLLLVWTRLW